MKKANRRIGWRDRIMTAALLVAAASSPWAQPTTYTVERKLALKDPTPQQPQALERGADEYLREMLAGGYQLASGDFNEDGVDELVLSGQSLAFRGSLGCSTVVLQLRGGTYTDEALGLTHEKVAGYRTLVVLDYKGAMSRWHKDSALNGKWQNVAEMKPPPGVPEGAAPAPTAAPPTAVPPTAAENGDDRAASVMGIRIGMPAAEAMDRLYNNAKNTACRCELPCIRPVHGALSACHTSYLNLRRLV